MSVLPTYLCDEALASGESVSLPEPELPPLNTLYVAIRSDAGPRSAAAVVRDELVRRLRRT